MIKGKKVSKLDVEKVFPGGKEQVEQLFDFAFLNAIQMKWVDKCGNLDLCVCVHMCVGVLVCVSIQ